MGGRTNGLINLCYYFWPWIKCILEALSVVDLNGVINDLCFNKVTNSFVFYNQHVAYI